MPRCSCRADLPAFYLQPDKPHRRVVAALIWDDEGKILVQQRPEGVKLALQWEFPGGKVEEGEGDVDALRRECSEELGVKVRVGLKAYQVDHTYEHLRVTLVIYHARMETNENRVPEARAAQELRWVKPEGLEELPFLEADVEIIRALAVGQVRKPDQEF